MTTEEFDKIKVGDTIMIDFPEDGERGGMTKCEVVSKYDDFNQLVIKTEDGQFFIYNKEWIIK